MSFKHCKYSSLAQLTKNVRFGKKKDSLITTSNFLKCKVNGFDVKMETFE